MFLRSILFFGSILALSAPQALAVPAKAVKVTTGRVHTLKTRADYTKIFKGDTPMVTFYSGKHCGPCKRMYPFFTNLAAVYKDVCFCLIDAGNPALQEIMDGLSIVSVPTLIFSHKGKVVKREVGGIANQSALEKTIKSFTKALP